MKPIWNFIDTGFNTGLFNMQQDELLASEVAKSNQKTILRFFQWQPYCISLGRHQKIEEIDQDRCQEENIDIVHRPTGGRAVLHAEELTYSLIFKNEISGSVEEIYYQISLALVEGLKNLGIPAEMVSTQPDFRQLYQDSNSISCFANSAKYEIQAQGKKLVGSAQKRYPEAVLQHGSILMGAYHRRLPEFLKCSSDEKQKLSQWMNEKTVDIQSVKPVSIADLKSSIKESIAKTFHIQFQ